MCGDKKIFNILDILEDLKKGRKICIREYAKRFEVSERTVQRYIKDLNCYFSKYNAKLESMEKGCYVFPQISLIKDRLINIKENEDFEKFADVLGILNKEVLEFLGIEEKVIKKIVDNDIFLVKENPVEKFLKLNIYKKIKSAIKYNKVLEIEYAPDEIYHFTNVKPLKIIFAEGNWYLAALSDDDINNGFKFLRINFIKNIKETSKTFKLPKEALEFLEDFQSLFSRYKVKPFEVVLEVNNEVKRFFKVKKFLPSQTIIEENEDSLTLRYYVTSEDEILLIVKKWLPFIRIKSPQSLKEKFKNELKNYLDSF